VSGIGFNRRSHCGDAPVHPVPLILRDGRLPDDILQTGRSRLDSRGDLSVAAIDRGASVINVPDCVFMISRSPLPMASARRSTSSALRKEISRLDTRIQDIEQLWAESRSLLAFFQWTV